MIVLLLPYVLVPLYRVVNPISNLMLWGWAIGERLGSEELALDSMAPRCRSR